MVYSLILPSRRSEFIVNVPRSALMAIVFMACVIGSFAINNTIFDVGVMLVMGLVGWFMEENDFPVAPAILGIVLGQMVEFNFITSMIKVKGDFSMFFSRPIAAAIGILTLMIWFSPLFLSLFRRLRNNSGGKSIDG